MKSREELLNKIEGIKALAERGVDGEKESAKKILARLMDKYGITEEEIAEDVKECEWFRYKDELQRRLLNQILYMILGNADTYKRVGGRHKLIGTYCTKAQKIEIEVNFEFFKKALEQELKLFFSAFCSKNRLFPPEEMAREATPEDDISELERLKLAFMMEGMEEHTMRKMLEG